VLYYIKLKGTDGSQKKLITHPIRHLENMHHPFFGQLLQSFAQLFPFKRVFC
jgi:hypothetical protein